MTLSPGFLDELRARTSLSTLIGRSVPLRKAGREFKGCCPFHKETSPSFIVNDEKGFYHCFGCGAHGDAIRFLTETRGLSFMDAVRELADQAGMRIPNAEPEKHTARPQIAGESLLLGKKGGAKLNRSETVTVRLDPKLNYLCELAARAQRRTKSSFIEWAVADALRSVSLPEVVETEDFGSEREVSIQEKASQLWHVDESDRVAALALTAPALLTHEEQLIWRLIRENGYLWRGRYDKQGEWSWTIGEGNLVKERLRENWDIFKEVALGERPKEDLPGWSKSLLDDDVPF
ncbi:MAG: hypothetical protein JO276_01270 [Sphingomonadaceae bacterium]|nr:hypothetical protein [Sphingomonadaceae bacterium]